MKGNPYPGGERGDGAIPMGPEPVPVKKRADYLPPQSLFGLHSAAHEVMKSYDSLGVYLVGSCLRSKDYRDVDVRCMMRDDDFEAMFPKDENGHRPRWMLTCLSLSAWFRQVTGLPVDFQFQKQTLANEKYPSRAHPRNSLGYYHWLGDAAA